MAERVRARVRYAQGYSGTEDGGGEDEDGGDRRQSGSQGYSPFTETSEGPGWARNDPRPRRLVASECTLWSADNISAGRWAHSMEADVLVRA